MFQPSDAGQAQNASSEILPESNFTLPIEFAQAIMRREARPLSYREALGSISRIRLDEITHDVPQCEQTLLLTHGYKTNFTMLIFNGIGERSEDIRGGAEKVHNLGWNVFVPRLPRHGGRGVYGSKRDLSLDDLLLCIEESVPIAAELGTKLVVTGASLGGLMAGLAATRFPQLISDVLIVQPPLSLHGIPDQARSLVVDIVRLFKDSDRLPILNTRAPGGSSHAMACGGELVLFLEQVLATKSIPESIAVNIRYDQSDPMFGNEGGKKLLALLKTQNKNLDAWEFPFHTIEGDNPDWGPAYQTIFEQLEKFARDLNLEGRPPARPRIEE